jgi:acetate kinase
VPMAGYANDYVSPRARLRQQPQGHTVRELDHILNFESGLFGVSGVSNDLRESIKQ